MAGPPLCRNCSDPNCPGCGDETNSKEHDVVLDINICVGLDVIRELKVRKETDKKMLDYNLDKKIPKRISNTIFEIMSGSNLYDYEGFNLKQTSHSTHYSK